MPGALHALDGERPAQYPSDESAMLASPAEPIPAPLLARIIEVMRPEQIWLFGSRV